MIYRLTIILVVAIAANIQANNSWIDLGAGFSSAGVAGGAGLSIQHKWQIYSLRLTGTAESIEEKITAGEILFGICRTGSDNLQMSISIGLAKVKGVRRGELKDGWIFGPFCEKLYFGAWGLAVQSQLYFTKRYGVQLFLNLNDEESFGGVLLCYRFQL